MKSRINRRQFVVTMSRAMVASSLTPAVFAGHEGDPIFRISLAQWSLHRALRAGEIDALSFPVVARRDYGIAAVEYVNTFYSEHVSDQGYLRRLKQKADGAGVRNLLIMCDGEGALGDPDRARRKRAVENHHKWVEAAAFLGCHSIRVNAQSEDELAAREQQRLVADGLAALCDFADGHDINVLVENHGGLSSDGSWLAGVMKLVDHPRVGTLPDFGNFLISPGHADADGVAGHWYDRYQGVRELMPYAKAVSAKSNDFDGQGRETSTDYWKMMKIVLEGGYRGFVGIEYEGSRLSEPDGIKGTKALLERVRSDFTVAR